MSHDAKKISFSFSKIKKPSLIVKTDNKPTNKIEYVDCFDGAKGKFSYKGNVKNEDVAKKELVIPMVTSNISLNPKGLDVSNSSSLKGGDDSKGRKSEVLNLDSEKVIENLAASEILKDIRYEETKRSNGITSINEQITLEMPSKGVVESVGNDIDYGQVPVTDFGMAMLRGMGWNPNSGLGKKPRLVSTVSPKLRPKGLGLGAKHKTEKTDEVATNTNKN